MLKSTNSKQTKARTNGQLTSKVIKNGHTAIELAESGERWATHRGQHMTLDEVLVAEAAKQKKVTVYNLPAVVEGGIDEFIEQFRITENAERLKEGTTV